MKTLLRILIPGLLLAAVPATATDTDWSVLWETTSLAQAAAANNLTIYFGVGLTSGGGNTYSSYVTLTEFDLGGGQPVDFIIHEGLGSAFGSIADGMQLDDLNAFYAGVLQEFRPGKKFNFRMNITALDDGGMFPDSLSFALYGLNSEGLIIPLGTVDPQNGLVAARVDLRSGPLAFETYPSSYAPDGPDIYVPAPVIQPYATAPDPSPVPEPGGATLAAIGLALCVVRRWRR